MRMILIAEPILYSCGNGGIGHALATRLREKGETPKTHPHDPNALNVMISFALQFVPTQV